MKKKQLVFRPTGEARLPKENEIYLQPHTHRLCIATNNWTSSSVPIQIYKAVEEVIDVPLWRAEYRELYYYITEQGKVSSYNLGGDYVDESMYELGNHFQTEEEAQKYLVLTKFILTERLLDNPEFSAMVEKLKGELQ